MKPLITMQKALTWFCVLPAVESSGKRKRIVYIIFSGIVFGTIFFQVVASIAFVRKVWSIDFEKSLHGVHPIGGWIPLLCVFGIIIHLKREIVEIFDALSLIYQNYADEEVFRYLEQANNKSEIFWQKYMKYVFCGFGATTVLSYLGSVLGLILSGDDFDTENLHSQFGILLPWNQSTPKGYAAESFYSIFACQIYLIFNGVILVLFLSFCLHHQAFYEMLRFLIGKLENDESDFSNGKKALCELIDCHCFARSWFHATAKVYNPIALMFLSFYIIALALIVYQIDLELQHASSDVFQLLAAFGVAVTNLYVYCYFGKSATDSFMKMADCFYESNWYDFPVEFQKYIILMIGCGGKVLRYHGYNICTLNPETFAELMKTIFTYYMVLKTFVEE